MNSYLVQYNRRTRHLQVQVFTGQDRPQAIRERLRLERLRTDSDLEIVVLNSNSEDDLRVTHSRYFKSPTELMASFGAHSDAS